MRSPTRVLLLGCLAASVGLPLGTNDAHPDDSQSGSGPATAWIAIDSTRGQAGDTLTPVGPDSLSIGRPGGSGPQDTTAPAPVQLDVPAVPDSDAALGAWLDRVAADESTLVGGDRRVLGEIVAAAREMLSSGDPEATRLLAADAVLVLRRRPR